MSSPSSSPASAARPVHRAGWIARFYGSVIGKKIAMALSGIVLVGYVALHMSGNLLAYRGAGALDGYAAFLQSNLLLLWSVRIVLAASLAVHVHAGFALAALARAARPERYALQRRQRTTWAGRLMRASGVLLLAFVVFHILHFTTGTILPSRVQAGAVYANVVRSFSIGWVAAFYVVSMAALVLHLQHGVWSLFQTLGATHPHLDPARRGLAWLLSLAIPIGFAAVPLGVVFGLLR